MKEVEELAKIKCKHNESIVEISRGVTHGTCKICGQVRQYDTLVSSEPPKIIKVGRINGIIVPPPAENHLALPTQEAAELRARKREEKVAPAAEEHVTGLAATVWRRGNKRKLRAKYFEDNKEAILQDYRFLALREFLKKWHIATQAWQKLKLLWAVPPKGPGDRYTGPAANKIAPKSERGRAAGEFKKEVDQLPPFPAFDNSWPFRVQEKWLEVYQALREQEKALGGSPETRG